MRLRAFRYRYIEDQKERRDSKEPILLRAALSCFPHVRHQANEVIPFLREWLASMGADLALVLSDVWMRTASAADRRQSGPDDSARRPRGTPQFASC